LNNTFIISEDNCHKGQSKFDYTLRISRRAKNLQLQINQQGELQVILPYQLRSFDYIAFVKSKSNWILKHKRSKSNNDFLYFGEKIYIEANYDLFEAGISYKFENNILQINLSSSESSGLNQLYNNWLYLSAKNFIVNRALSFALKYNFNPKKISIRKQKTRWGSCSAKKTISLNYKIMMMPLRLIDYVIIHELCHLNELNHSKEFWLLVELFLPDYKMRRKELKQLHI
jgi:predicted metal-dependent hydrolase